VAFIVYCALGSASFGVLLYYFFARTNKFLDAFHQKLAMGLFSVTVTTIVVILGLALPVDVLGQLSGRIGFITFTLAGPPAIWVVVFLITAKVFNSPVLGADLELNFVALGRNLEPHYRRLGWNHYRHWRAELNSYQRVIERSELHFIDDLLPKVFYHGRFDLLKPQRVTNTTLFFFSQKGAVKFQRIQGEARIENGKRSEIYLPQTSSTPEGRTTCLHFIRNEDRLAQTGKHTHGEWKIAPFKNIDMLLVAVYENDELEDGDYVYIDVSKYIDLESMDSAALNMMIVSDRCIEEYNVWEVAASLVSTEKPVPLMFRTLDSQANRRKSGMIEKNLEQIARLFGGWDVMLDEAANGKLGATVNVSRDEVEELFVKVKSILNGFQLSDHPCAFQRLFERPQATDCVLTKLKHQHNVILSTFTWC
jgi:hypothetical protein